MSRLATTLSGLLVLALGAGVVAAGVTQVYNVPGLLYVAAAAAAIFGFFRMLGGIFNRPYPTQGDAVDGVQAWSLGEALGKAMDVFRRAGWMLALVMLPVPLISFGASVAAAMFMGLWRGPDAAPTTTLVSSMHPSAATTQQIAIGITAAAGVIGSIVATVLVMPFLIRGVLAGLRQEKVRFSDLGPALRYIPRLFVFVVFYQVIVLIGAPALTIPALPFVFTPFFIVDQDLGLFEAMRRSYEVGTRHLAKVFGYHIAFIPLAIVGQVTGIGILVTLPFYWTGIAYAYVRITGKNELPWYPPEYASRSIRSYLKISLAALSVLFAGLIFWVENLPTLRGTAWSVQDMIVRVAAILCGVGAVIVLLALLLPYVLDNLEGDRFTSYVAARHVRSQKSGFLTIISILSICGVAISSCALSSVVSVMGGFSHDLKRKILGNNAHIVIDTTPGTPFADYQSALDRVRQVPGVTGAAPVSHGEVMASSPSNLAGVVVTGIEPASIMKVIELGQNIEVGKVDYLEHPDKLAHLPANEVIGIGPGGESYYKGTELPAFPDDIDPAVRAVILDTKPERPGVILGRELAKTLHVYIGDEITLVSPLGDLGPMGIMPKTKKFRVAAIFYSGMYEYDATYVYTMLDVAQDYFTTPKKISAIEVKVADAEHADNMTEPIIAALARPELRVRDWHEINKNLFSALKLERFATFVILLIAIAVASFCIICTLLLMVTEKGKEIAILKAIGASDSAILRTFMIEGMIIGGIGTTFGVATGLAVCTGLSWFGLRLDPDVYYIDRLPINVNGWEFLGVAGAAMAICALSTVYPAYAASRLRPVDGLRYE